VALLTRKQAYKLLSKSQLFLFILHQIEVLGHCPTCGCKLTSNLLSLGSHNYSFQAIIPKEDISSSVLSELDNMMNMPGRDDIPNLETTYAVLGKEASDLESGFFNPSIDNASISPPGEDRENNVIDWDGPADPENPLNWPRGKRVSHVALVSIITFIS
jgi:hypothetical protein